MVLSVSTVCQAVLVHVYTCVNVQSVSVTPVHSDIPLIDEPGPPMCSSSCTVLSSPVMTSRLPEPFSGTATSNLSVASVSPVPDFTPLAGPTF